MTLNISHKTHIWVCVEFICNFRQNWSRLRRIGVFSKIAYPTYLTFKATSDWILMILYSLDPSRWEESNGSKIIFLASILIDLFQKCILLYVTSDIHERCSGSYYNIMNFTLAYLRLNWVYIIILPYLYCNLNSFYLIFTLTYI